MKDPEALYWCDTETEGLHEEHGDRIVEIWLGKAPFHAPAEVQEIYHVVLPTTEARVARWPEEVREMHTKSGLLAEALKSTVNPIDIIHDLLKLVPYEKDKEKKPLFAGSTVGFDQRFLQAYYPSFAERFSHRVFDVSAIKLFCRTLGMPPIPKGEAHRAKADVMESIAHYKLCDQWLEKYYTSLKAMKDGSITYIHEHPR